jgi:DNA-directed RNA polymerase subunit beta
MSDSNVVRVGEDTSSFKIVNFGSISKTLDIPPLIEVQTASYNEFLQVDTSAAKRKRIGLQSVFEDSFPIESSNGDVVLEFVEYTLGEPKRDIWDCKVNGLTYAAPLKATIRLIAIETGEVREQEVYMGDLPMMSPTGTFIINGAERVIVNQLHRSPGIFIFFDDAKNIFSSRIIPDHKGSWLEFEMDAKGLLIARIDRRKKFPFTLLLKALGYGTNEQILRLFYESESVTIKGVQSKALQKFIGRRILTDVANPETGEILIEAGQALNEDNLDILKDAKIDKIELIVNKGAVDHRVVFQSLDKDGVNSTEEALMEFIKHQKPLDYSPDHGDAEKRVKNIERASNELQRLFFDPKTYNMGSVGRYKINARFKHLNSKEFGENADTQTLRPIDIVETCKYMVNLIHEVPGYQYDDIDHLGNRRVRTVGELLTTQMKAGFTRMERVVKERMSMNDVDIMTPQLLISIKPITAVINEFFGASQLVAVHGPDEPAV